MFFPLTVADFIDRAEAIYPERVAVIDEPDQPAPSWGEVGYRELAARARALAANLDRLGIPVGARVAIASHNSARMLAAFFGVSGSGRILVPINFRLSAAEIDYILGHSGASMLMIDPALKDLLGTLGTQHNFVLGDTDDELFRADADPRPWDGDEGATATINYTSGTTARPKGVQLTHRNLWINAVTFGWHALVSGEEVRTAGACRTRSPAWAAATS